MISDFKYALRSVTKTPGFTITAVITLALAIGANTAIFSLINDLFLRGLSFKEPRRVVHFLSNAPDRKLVDLPLSLPRFQHYRAGQTMCEDLAAENVFAFTLTGLGDAVQLFGGRVTSNYFDVLGLRPIRGRNFLPNEEEGADVAMVTENFWQKRMGGDPNVIGRSITLDGVSYFFQAVVGIRATSVTGVQTCALPILRVVMRRMSGLRTGVFAGVLTGVALVVAIEGFGLLRPGTPEPPTGGPPELRRPWAPLGRIFK